MDDVRRAGPHTRIIHGGQRSDPETGAVSMPIYQSSTFAFRDAEEGAARFGGAPGCKYTRRGNPTTEALERNIALLEHGCGALGAASGMAAINAVYLALLEQGSHAGHRASGRRATGGRQHVRVPLSAESSAAGR